MTRRAGRIGNLRTPVIPDGQRALDWSLKFYLNAVIRSRWTDILTVEVLAQDSKLYPLQEAFMEVGAMQFGFYTPGMCY